jgi:magnesium transporter
MAWGIVAPIGYALALRPMLQVYSPSLPLGTVIVAEAANALPADTVWIDLIDPTAFEEKLVEQALRLSIPTREEMDEIEPSSRLYEDQGALFLTATVLAGLATDDPISTPISFVLTGKHLITVRYANPKPFRLFADHVARQPELLASSTTTLVRLLDAIVDRLADALEQTAAELETISHQVFRRAPGERGRRIPALKLEALLVRIGTAQNKLAKARETAGSMARLLTYLSSSSHCRAEAEQRELVRSISEDVTSLIDHSGFLSNNVTFLLDAALGLISVEQNAILKIFSVASVILLPPTLVGAIYGMNFDHMPELKWLYGYPLALVIMLLSAIMPYLYFRRRGWL